MTHLSFNEFIGPVALRSLALLACVEIVMLVLRRRMASAAQMHLVLLTGVILLLALPAISLVLPAARVVEFQRASASAPAAAARVETALRAMLSASEIAPSSTPRLPVATNTASSLSRTFSEALVSEDKEISAATPTVVQTIKITFFIVYFVGVALSGLRFGMGYLLLLRISRKRYQDIVDPAWQSRISALSRTQGGERRIRLRRSVGTNPAPFGTPVTYGIIQPTLLLPVEILDGGWSNPCTDAVLRHEIAHIQRQDSAAQLLVNIACVLHWFNPWVWILARRLNAAAEAACDDRALQAGVEAADYAEHLLFVARTTRRREPVTFSWSNLWRADAALGMALPRTSVEDRLASILAPQRNRAIVPAGTVAAILGLALIIVAPATAMRRTEYERRLAAALPGSRNSDALALLRRVQAATLRLKSMTADFTYTEKTVATTGEWATRLGKDGQSFSAHVEMMRPNFARVRFTHMVKPAFPNLIACDGKTVYRFTPKSFLSPRQFAPGGYDPAVLGRQASGELPGGGSITTAVAKPSGENVHLWDAAPVQAFFDPIAAMRNWVFVGDWSELRYEGRVTHYSVTYEVLGHHLVGGTTNGHGSPFEQHIYIGPDNLIHGYLLEYVCENKPAYQLAWLKNIKTNVPLNSSDFAFTPPMLPKESAP